MLHSHTTLATHRRKVFIGIGSNLKPEIHIPWALTALHQCFPGLTQSKIYQNPAIGCSGPDFWNMVVQLPFSGSLDALSRTLKHLESQAEGDQLHKVGPRSRCLDLDILVFGNDVFQRASFTNKLDRSHKQSAIPRLEAFEFSYVLIPYLDLDPNLNIPGIDQATKKRWLAQARRDQHGTRLVHLSMIHPMSDEVMHSD